jgi:hypothetical protein
MSFRTRTCCATRPRFSARQWQLLPGAWRPLDRPARMPRDPGTGIMGCRAVLRSTPCRGAPTGLLGFGRRTRPHRQSTNRPVSQSHVCCANGFVARIQATTPLRPSSMRDSWVGVNRVTVRKVQPASSGGRGTRARYGGSGLQRPLAASFGWVSPDLRIERAPVELVIHRMQAAAKLRIDTSRR